MMIQDLQNISQQVNSYNTAARTNVSLPQRYPPPLIPVRNTNGSPRYIHPYSTTNADAVDLSNSLTSRYENRNQLDYHKLTKTHFRSQQQQQQTQQQAIRSEENNHLISNGRSSVDIGKKLTPIAETPTSGTHIPYKMQKAFVEGKMIPCINMKPFVWTELLVTLPDIITHFFNPVPLCSCRRVMDVLGIELYRGNRCVSDARKNAFVLQKRNCEQFYFINFCFTVFIIVNMECLYDEEYFVFLLYNFL